MRVLRGLLCSLILAFVALDVSDASALLRAAQGADQGADQSPRQSPGRPSFGARVGGPELPGGGLIACPLPAELHRRNIGSPPPDGPGCCVFRSLDHAASWQNVPVLDRFPEWMVENGIAGGGYPEKVDKLIPQIARSRSMPAPQYLQVESSDLEILKLACKTGRMVSSTYGLSPTGRYGGKPINHMVNTVHADDRTFVVLDNNYVGPDAYEHMTPAEFLHAYRAGADSRGRLRMSDKGWSVILLGPPPPPPVRP